MCFEDPYSYFLLMVKHFLLVVVEILTRPSLFTGFTTVLYCVNFADEMNFLSYDVAVIH